MEIYLLDSYIREFESVVLSVCGNKIFLDRTAFYPESGGQPCDRGFILRDKEEFPVVFVNKISSTISHEVSVEGLHEGDRVTGKIDWSRRYLFMRYHTACHILSGVINKETGAQITGNQIDSDKTRIDFSLENFNKEEIKKYEDKVNNLIKQSLPVSVKFLSREKALEIPSVVKLRMQLPEEIKEVRIIEIEGFDQQACGGTHVKNTSEINQIEIIKAENKGKANRRIHFKIK